MTLAWYGHLKFKAVSLAVVILVSWGIAFVEYCFAVPANRIGSSVYSPAELKTIQEVITLIVFAGFTAGVFQRAVELDAGCGLCPDRAWRGPRLSRPSVMFLLRYRASRYLSAIELLDGARAVRSIMMTGTTRLGRRSLRPGSHRR